MEGVEVLLLLLLPVVEVVVSCCGGRGWFGGAEVWERGPVEAFLVDRLSGGGEVIDLRQRAAHEGYAFREEAC